MEIKYVPIGDIIPYEKNPRKNDPAVDYVVSSIREFGFKNPIILDKNNVIVAGHTRLLAAKRLKMKEWPCIYAEDLSEEQVRAFRLVDNKTAEFAEWDTTKLQEELDALYEAFDMEMFGFSIQIENIDLKGELEEAQEKFARELDEANNYVVLEFFTEDEWDRAQELFGLERVQTNDKNPKIRRYGIGRVIDGREWLEKLERLVAEEDEH